MQHDESPHRLPQSLLRMLLNIAQHRDNGAAEEEALPDGLDRQTLLNQLLEGFHATGAAYWTDLNGRPLLAGPEQAAFSQLAARHAAARILQPPAAIVAPDASLQPASFANARQLLTIPYLDAAGQMGCVQLLLAADRTPNDQLLCLQAAKLIANRQRAPAAGGDRPLSSGSNRQLLTTLLGFHSSLDLPETTYRIANDARHLLDCDRVSVLLRSNKGYRLHAASGQVQPDRRANTVRELERLVQHVLIDGDPFNFPDVATSATSTSDGAAAFHEMPPQIERALNAYLDISPTRSLRIEPLVADACRKDSEPVEAATKGSHPVARDTPFGALVFEQFRDRPFERAEANLPWLREAATAALSNSQTHQNVFLLPLWRSLGRWWNEPKGHVRRRFLLAIAVAAAVSIWFIPARFEVVVDGALRPVERRHVFATANGVVQNVMVKHGDHVSINQPLALLENPELTRNLDELLGQTQIATQQLASIKSLRLSGTAIGDASGGVSNVSNVSNENRLAAEQQRLLLQLENLRKQYELLDSQKEQMEIKSPSDGTVVTWDVEQAIAARPLERGQQIMTIANEAGPWQLELHVRDRQAGHLRTAQREIRGDLPVTFALGTEPHGRYQGTLSHVAQSSQIHPELGSSIKVTVSIDGNELSSRHDGAGVRAKIDCGPRSLGYVWFHQLIDLVQSKLLFHLR